MSVDLDGVTAVDNHTYAYAGILVADIFLQLTLQIGISIIV